MGARTGRPSEAEQATGLDGLQDLLGRLNGKASDRLKAEQSARQTFSKPTIVESQRAPNFVSGGFLVGDKLQTLPAAAPQPIREPHKTTEAVEVGKPKRKHQRPSCYTAGETSKPCHETATAQAHLFRLGNCQGASGKLGKKSQRRMRRGSCHALSNGGRSDLEVVKPCFSPQFPLQAQDEVEGESTSAIGDSNQDSVTRGPRSGGGSRHGVRQRYIKQKRMAMMDAKALNEVYPTCNAQIIPVNCVPS